MRLNEKRRPDGPGNSAAIRPDGMVSARALEDDLPRFCLEPDPAESNRAVAWAISICLVYLVLGLIGIQQPAILLHKRPPAPEEAVPTVIEPLRTPVQASAPGSQPEQPPSQRTSEAGVPLVAVTPNSEAVAFSVPTIGNILVPMSMAQPPPERPMQPLQPISSLKIEPAAPPKLVPVSAPKIEEIGMTAISGARPPPAYPHESLENREQGAVVLRIEVAPSGNILSVTVQQSSGFPRLDQAALEQVRRHWLFAPADGKRLYDSRIVFRLQ